MAATVGSPASMLPATLMPGAATLPHQVTQFWPVQAAVRPWRSTACTWRMPRPASPANAPLDGGVGRQAARQGVEDGGREVAVGEGLGGDGTDPGAHERAGRADGERLGGDGHGEGAGGGVMRDNGPGHGEPSLSFPIDHRHLPVPAAEQRHPSRAVGNSDGSMPSATLPLRARRGNLPGGNLLEVRTSPGDCVAALTRNKTPLPLREGVFFPLPTAVLSRRVGPRPVVNSQRHFGSGSTLAPNALAPTAPAPTAPAPNVRAGSSVTRQERDGQSFPARHGASLSLACFPRLAFLGQKRYKIITGAVREPCNASQGPPGTRGQL